MITEITDVEHVGCRFALVSPFFTVSVKDTMTEKISQSCMEFGSLDVVFKVGWWMMLRRMISFGIQTYPIIDGITFEKVFYVLGIDRNDIMRYHTNAHFASNKPHETLNIDMRGANTIHTQ